MTRIFSAILFLALSANTFAGVSVSPTTVGFTSSGMQQIRVKNTGDADMIYKFKLMTWSLEQKSKDILIFPPVSKLRPGEVQVLRIAVRTPNKVSENAYRLVIESADKRFTIRIPIFVNLHKKQHKLRAEKTERGLLLTNTGQAHVKITGMDRGGTVRGQLLYLLAGQSKLLDDGNDISAIITTEKTYAIY